MSTATFVVYACCGDVYPKPAETVCPGCEAPHPAWQDWMPEEEATPGIGQLTDILVGLLMRLEALGELQEVDGRLPEIVRDALVVISHSPSPNVYADFYTEAQEEQTR
jgi:hypothetical protein